MRLWRGALPDAEAERLAGLMAAAFTERERGWSAGELAGLAARPGVVIAAAEHGFGIVRTVSGEAEILTLAVGPEARGAGLGRALLGALLDAAAERGAASVFLEVGAGNEAALRLYASAGFVEAARRPGYFRRADGSREDALVLEAALPAGRS